MSIPLRILHRNVAEYEDRVRFKSFYFDEFYDSGLIGKITKMFLENTHNRCALYHYYNNLRSRNEYITKYNFTFDDLEAIFKIAINEENSKCSLLYEEMMSKTNDDKSKTIKKYKKNISWVFLDQLPFVEIARKNWPFIEIMRYIAFDYLLRWIKQYYFWRDNMHGFLNGMIGRMYEKRNRLVKKLALPDDVICIIEQYLGTKYK